MYSICPSKGQCPLITKYYEVNSYNVNSKDKTVGIVVNLDSNGNSLTSKDESSIAVDGNANNYLSK